MTNKYKNPDSRCTLPTSELAGDYCWSFAHYIDGTQGFEDMTAICETCEHWNKAASEQVVKR